MSSFFGPEMTANLAGGSGRRTSLLLQHHKRNSSTWGFFAMEESIQEAISATGSGRSPGANQLHPGLKAVYEWADEQGDDAEGEPWPLEGSVAADLDGLPGVPEIVKLFRKRDDLLITLREDHFAAVAVHGARLVRYKRKGLLGYMTTNTHAQFCVALSFSNQLYVRWVRYSHVKLLSRTASRLYMPEAMSAWSHLKETEHMFADRECTELLARRLFGIREFLAMVLEELPDIDILVDWLNNTPYLGHCDSRPTSGISSAPSSISGSNRVLITGAFSDSDILSADAS
jgi:hypothetical protein